MPIHEYQCRKCGYIFEEIMFKGIPKISTKCPVCGEIAKRVISSSNFRIKGYSEKNGYSREE